MSLLDKMRKRLAVLTENNAALPTEDQLEARIAQGEVPRHSAIVGDWLAAFWQTRNEASATALARSRFRGAQQGLFFYQDLMQRLQQTPLPASPGGRYDAFVAGLRQLLFANWAELGGNNEGFAVEHLRLVVSLTTLLRAVELHDACCDLLVAVNQAVIKERGGSLSAELTNLRHEIHACLLRMPPDHIPHFWEQLKDPNTTLEFWPVVARMRDRRAVPFLLDTLPGISPDGQSKILAALGEIGDARAIPALRQLAENPQNLVGRQAQLALTRLLRESGEDAVQLLRPTDSRHAGTAGDTLLRPAGTTPEEAVKSEELLRASQAQKQS